MGLCDLRSIPDKLGGVAAIALVARHGTAWHEALCVKMLRQLLV